MKSPIDITSDQNVDEFAEIQAPQVTEQLQQEIACNTEKIDQITEQFEQGLQSIFDGRNNTYLSNPCKKPASSAQLPMSLQVIKQMQQNWASTKWNFTNDTEVKL